MSVEIEPMELGFRRMLSAFLMFRTTCTSGTSPANQLCYFPGPFTVEVSQILKLKNPNKAPVAFKVGLYWSNT